MNWFCESDVHVHIMFNMIEWTVAIPNEHCIYNIIGSQL